VLVIPENYGRDLESGEDTAVQLVLDGTDSNTAVTVLGYANGVIAQVNAERVRRRVDAAPVSIRAAARPVIDYQPRVWYNPELKSTQFLVPGLIGMILMLTAVVSTALSVVREKERGTMEQLLVTPLRPAQILAGKTVPYLGISLVATAVILAAGRVFFGIHVQGPYLSLFAATLLYLIGALGLGLLVSSFSDTQAQAYQVGATISILPAVFLSGFIYPIRSMPQILQWVSYIVPARYYLVIIRGVILKGSGLAPYARPMSFLALYCTVVLLLTWMRLSRREVRG
jgi:ABC-2 type transport system permease protein